MYGVIDIGGTKTIFGLIDSQRQLTSPVKIPTPSTYENLLEQVKEYFKNKSLKSVGVSTAGFVNRLNGDMTDFGPNIDWGKQNFADDLKSVTGKPVRIDNDANCGALGEAIYGSGADYQSVLYITVSTGIGTGFVFDKKIVLATANTEGGKIFYKKNNQYRRLEEFVSGSAIKNRYGVLASEITDKNIWEEICSDLAPGVQAMATMFVPEVIVFGGSVGRQFTKFENPLLDFFKANPYGMPVPEFKSALDASRAVINGAYELARSVDADKPIWK